MTKKIKKEPQPKKKKNDGIKKDVAIVGGEQLSEEELEAAVGGALSIDPDDDPAGPLAP